MATANSHRIRINPEKLMTIEDYNKSNPKNIPSPTTIIYNIYCLLLKIYVGGAYIYVKPFQEELILQILNMIGRNAKSDYDLTTEEHVHKGYTYVAFFRKDDSALFIINLDTESIRHVKYQFEGLIGELNEERPSKKQKSSS